VLALALLHGHAAASMTVARMTGPWSQASWLRFGARDTRGLSPTCAMKASPSGRARASWWVAHAVVFGLVVAFWKIARLGDVDPALSAASNRFPGVTFRALCHIVHSLQNRPRSRLSWPMRRLPASPAASATMRIKGTWCPKRSRGRAHILDVAPSRGRYQKGS